MMQQETKITDHFICLCIKWKSEIWNPAKLESCWGRQLWWCGDDQDDDNKDDQRDNDDDGDDNNDDQGDNDDYGCRTGQSGWEDGNSKCKSEGDIQLATIKWAIIKSIELSDYIKLLDYIELSDYIESEGDAQLATIKWVIDNWLDAVSMRK